MGDFSICRTIHGLCITSNKTLYRNTLFCYVSCCKFCIFYANMWFGQVWTQQWMEVMSDAVYVTALLPTKDSACCSAMTLQQCQKITAAWISSLRLRVTSSIVCICGKLLPVPWSLDGRHFWQWNDPVNLCTSIKYPFYTVNGIVRHHQVI